MEKYGGIINALKNLDEEKSTNTVSITVQESTVSEAESIGDQEHPKPPQLRRRASKMRQLQNVLNATGLLAANTSFMPGMRHVNSRELSIGEEESADMSSFYNSIIEDQESSNHYVPLVKSNSIDELTSSSDSDSSSSSESSSEEEQEEDPKLSQDSIENVPFEKETPPNDNGNPSNPLSNPALAPEGSVASKHEKKAVRFPALPRLKTLESTPSAKKKSRKQISKKIVNISESEADLLGAATGEFRGPGDAYRRFLLGNAQINYLKAMSAAEVLVGTNSDNRRVFMTSSVKAKEIELAKKKMAKKIRNLDELRV